MSRRLRCGEPDLEVRSVGENLEQILRARLRLFSALGHFTARCRSEWSIFFQVPDFQSDLKLHKTEIFNSSRLITSLVSNPVLCQSKKYKKSISHITHTRLTLNEQRAGEFHALCGMLRSEFSDRPCSKCTVYYFSFQSCVLSMSARPSTVPVLF